MAERLKIADKFFLNAENERTRHAAKDSHSVVFVFANDEVEDVTVSLDDISQDMLNAAAAYGLSQKLGDAYSGAAKQDNPAAWAAEQVGNVVDQITAGLWVAQREGGGGPKFSMLTEAIVRAAAEGGDEADPEVVKQRLADDENLRKNALKNPAIERAYAAIQAERAAAKAAKLAEAEDEGDTDLSAFTG